MAIVRTAGTEIIRSAQFKDCGADENTRLILGVQHHIYTVLSILCFADSMQTQGNQVQIKLTGWDADNAASATEMKIIAAPLNDLQTFVFNDKFSFNGYEPTGVSSQLSTAVEQDAIADQGGSVSQYLWADSSNNSDSINIFITYIDQNNS